MELDCKRGKRFRFEKEFVSGRNWVVMFVIDFFLESGSISFEIENRVWFGFGFFCLGCGWGFFLGEIEDCFIFLVVGVLFVEVCLICVFR